MTNANPIDVNVNDKYPAFTCYKLLWLSRGNGKKKSMIIYKSKSVPFN